MTRTLAAATLAGLSAAVLAGAPQTPAPQTPTFRSGIEIFHLDVSVLDRDHRPVLGLTAADFTVLEDGKPQKIVALSAVEMPDEPPPAAEWMRAVSPDVTSNLFREQRLVLIVMDDATIPFDPRAVENAKTIGRGIVAGLGPADLAAVVFTQDNRRPQDFTGDRARLNEAIDRTSYGNRTGYSFLSAVETLWAAAELLIDIPERRKTLVYISGGVPIDIDAAATPVLASLQTSQASAELQRRLLERTREIFRQASQANVNVYTFDACGQRAPGASTRPRPCDAPFSGPDLNVEFLQTIAEGTGGKATIHTHDFAPGIERVFRENSSYYLVGYESSKATGERGRFRRLDVRVNRPGVDVRARTLNYTSAPRTAEAELPPVPTTQALAGLLPQVDVPLHVQLAPLAIPGERDLAAVAVTLGLRSPAIDAIGADAREIDFEVRAFDPEGRPRGDLQQQARIRLRPGANEFQIELLARLDVKPGAYRFRMAAHDRAGARSGSVYADVDVPDFARAPLSLSGVFLSSTAAPPAAPSDALKALLPVMPTANRDFDRSERVTAFVRVYQGGGAETPVRPVTLTVRVEGANATAGTETTRLAEPRFVDRVAELGFPVNVSRLSPGPYVLTIEVAIDEKTRARRDVRFSVR